MHGANAYWRKPIIKMKSPKTTRGTCTISSHPTGQSKLQSTHSSCASVVSSVSAPDGPHRDEMSENPIIPSLWSLPAAVSSVEYVVSSSSNHSNGNYQEAICRMSWKLVSRLGTEIDTKIDRAVHQRLEAPLPALLETECHASVYMAKTHYIASLEKKAQIIEARASQWSARSYQTHSFPSERGCLATSRARSTVSCPTPMFF